MNMNNRSYSLVINSFIYSMVSVCLAGASIAVSSRGMLYGSIVSFIVMVLSLVLAFVIEEGDEAPSKLLLGVSFAMLVPFGILIFIVTAIGTYIGLIIESLSKGGENDD